VENINYLEEISNTPPPEVVEHAKKLFNKDYIVYKSEYALNPITGLKERMSRCKCTACGTVFYETYLPAGNGCSRGMARSGFINSMTNEAMSSGKHMLCSQCGAEVEVKHSTDVGRSSCMQQLFPINLQKLKDNKVALLQWVAQKNVDNNGDVSIDVLPCEGFVFDGKKSVRLNGQASNFYYRYFKGTWSQMKKSTDTFGSSKKELFVNLDAHTLDGTVLENAKLYEYCNATADCYPVSYLRIYQRYPYIENLVMQKASRLVNDYMVHSCNGYYGPIVTYARLGGINLKERQPAKMLGLTKTEFKQAVKGKWDKKDLEFYKQYKSNGLKLEDMKVCKKYSYYQLENCFKYETIMSRLFAYIEKQKARYSQNKNLVTPQYIYDYWDMVNSNGGDLTQSIVKYPKAIIKAHDEEAKKTKALKNEQHRQAFVSLAEKYSKYAFSYNGLCIRIAEQPEELTHEGKTLNHCVGRYIESHSNGEHCIFFIRKEESPDKPFFTLELDIGRLTVLQNRGKHNCSRTAEVEVFEAKWLEYLKQLPKERKRNGKRNSKHAA
jgi:hypothetical protein